MLKTFGNSAQGRSVRVVSASGMQDVSVRGARSAILKSGIQIRKPNQETKSGISNQHGPSAPPP